MRYLFYYTDNDVTSERSQRLCCSFHYNAHSTGGGAQLLHYNEAARYFAYNRFLKLFFYIYICCFLYPFMPKLGVCNIP